VHSWALGTARIDARNAGTLRDSLSRQWRVGRATDEQFLAAKVQESAAWKVVAATECALLAHRAETGCYR